MIFTSWFLKCFNIIKCTFFFFQILLMGRDWKTVALFVKIIKRYQGNISLSTIKDRNGMDQKEAEDIKKRWQKYTEDLYKKYLNDPDIYDIWTYLDVLDT